MGDIPDLFDTFNWQRWRVDPDLTYITAATVLGDGCIMFLEEPPNGYTYVVAGGYTHGLPINPSSHFNGDGSYRNRWKARIDFLPSTRPNPHSALLDAHVGCFLRVQANKTWDGQPNQTRFGCWINGMGSGEQAALQLQGTNSNDPNDSNRIIDGFELSENPWDNPNHTYRIEIIEEEKLVSGTWKLQWGGEVWNATNNTKIGEYKWLDEDDLDDNDIELPALNGSRYAMGLGPNQGSEAAGAVVADKASTFYWDF